MEPMNVEKLREALSMDRVLVMDLMDQLEGTGLRYLRITETEKGLTLWTAAASMGHVDTERVHRLLRERGCGFGPWESVDGGLVLRVTLPRKEKE